MKIHYLTAGQCEHPEFVTIRGGEFKSIVFPSLVVAIEHPKHGVVLFDTGYSPRFYEQTRYFPERFYALVTPVHIREEETAVARLAKIGIKADDVRYVICSHFHADHIGGVGDFKKARYIYAEAGLQSLLSYSRIGQIRRGFLRGLLPSDFRERSKPVESFGVAEKILPFEDFHTGWDLFRDGTIFAVSLPGHALGQIGLFVRDGGDAFDFLVADAAWSGKAIRENRMPNPVTRILMSDFAEYENTLCRLHSFQKNHSNVRLIPCHCSVTIDSLRIQN